MTHFPRAGRAVRGAGCSIVALILLAMPSIAAADLVYLKNGRVLSVESWTLQGDVAVLVFREGGRMEAPQSAIEQVLPDEYPRLKLEPVVEARPPAPAVAGDLSSLVSATAARYGVDGRLAQAVVRIESNFQPRAVSPKGAMGLMQLMPAVAEQYAVADPFDPAENLDAGLRHLRGLLERFGNDVQLALAAYNAGLYAVTKYGGIPPYRETQNYVRKILALAK
jgi:soluble lytic murein transglycosylase-like protein